MDATGAPGSAAAARSQAASAVPEALRSPADGGPAVVDEPVSVVGSDGRHERWFVPVVSGDRLVGYVVVGGDLLVPRWSTFQRAPGRLEDCPPVEDWLDAGVIAARAAAVAAPARPSGPPVLSYHGVPDRLAWRVPLDDGRVAYVAGTAAWRD